MELAARSRAELSQMRHAIEEEGKSHQAEDDKSAFAFMPLICEKQEVPLQIEAPFKYSLPVDREPQKGGSKLEGRVFANAE